VPVADKQVAAPSFLRFAAIQGVDRKQNLAVLATTRDWSGPRDLASDDVAFRNQYGVGILG
jgi:hypothetical protein